MSAPTPLPPATPAVDRLAATRALAPAPTGLLAAFHDAEVLDAADVHVARRLSGLLEDHDELVLLALALAVRAVRGGSVCVDLDAVAVESGLPDLPWPEPAAVVTSLEASPLLQPSDGGVVALRLEGRLLYLDRYWREERQVVTDLQARSSPVSLDAAAEAVLDAGLDRVFPGAGYDEQRAAARVALGAGTTVLTGGPGTGKTTTVAALLALLCEQAELAGMPAPRLALAAPTGKAAARLQEAVQEQLALLPEADRARVGTVRAVTLHRLLGSRPDSAVRFRHHRENRLPHDVVVVDETSMVSLTLTARLLEAVRPDARLILVGDPDQLTSVEAGAVLADLVAGLEGRPGARVAALRTSHRFGRSIQTLAEAVRDGDADTVLAVLRAGGDHVALVDTGAGEGADEREGWPVEVEERLRSVLLPHALALREAAEAGDAAAGLDLLGRLRLLCAHRDGPVGVRYWNRRVERWLAEHLGESHAGEWYPGRPVLVTANDYGLGVYNGDVGVTVREPTSGGRGLRVHVAATAAPVALAPSRLGDVETMHAMTIHKSQGSQAAEVVVLLPPPDSRLLTRELLYTALTRAEERVVLVGSEADVRAAVERRAVRATGLAARLADPV